MNIEPRLGVTYTGKETPFKDRSYKSELTFMPGQTRMLPQGLANRFLRHTDVFERASEQAAAAASDADDQDSTSRQLAETEKANEAERQAENARFTLHMQIDKMDATAVRDFAKVNYKATIHHKVSVENARAQLKTLVDQYGAP